MESKGIPISGSSVQANQPINVVKSIPVVGGALNWLVDSDKIARASQDFRDAETMQGKIGEGAALALLVGINVLPGAGKAAEKGEVFVYTIFRDSKIVYVGITNDLLKARSRARSHATRSNSKGCNKGAGFMRRRAA